MLQVEIKGKKADHYRAYGQVKLLRKPTLEEQIAHLDKTGSSMPKRSKMRYIGEDIIAEGDVTTGAVGFSAPKDQKVTRVVFLLGRGDEETVVGSVDVNAGGKIDIEFIEPPPGPDAEPMIFEATGS